MGKKRRRRSTGTVGKNNVPSEPVSRKKSKKFWQMMFFICTAALIARVLILVEAWQSNPLAWVPIEDARVYWDWAAMIASGQLLYTTPFQSAPLYPYLLGLIRYLGGDGIWLKGSQSPDEKGRSSWRKKGAYCRG